MKRHPAWAAFREGLLQAFRDWWMVLRLLAWPVRAVWRKLRGR